jgi:hypothetical protein
MPISIPDYARLHVKANRGAKEAEVRTRLKGALAAYQAGERCDCGEPIWVIGSAEVGHMWLTCITGESDPSQDYEIAEACDKDYRCRAGKRG